MENKTQTDGKTSTESIGVTEMQGTEKQVEYAKALLEREIGYISGWIEKSERYIERMTKVLDERGKTAEQKQKKFAPKRARIKRWKEIIEFLKSEKKAKNLIEWLKWSGMDWDKIENLEDLRK
jgi:hypothetical protein